MPHAQILDGQYVDDDLQPIPGPEFDEPEWLSRTLRNAVEQLAPQREYVPDGWKRLFDQTLRKLQAVDCPQRSDVALSEIAFGQGEMVIAAHGSGADEVVHGILGRLRQASAATCECCGTRYRAVYRPDRQETLCSRCHVHTHLEEVLEDIESSAPRYTQEPIIEWDALPANLQILIPKEDVRTVYLQALGVRLRYVTPETLRARRHEISVLRRALAAARASRASHRDGGR